MGSRKKGIFFLPGHKGVGTFGGVHYVKMTTFKEKSPKQLKQCNKNAFNG